MACSHSCQCGCCAGRHSETPSALFNPPAQPAIAYRIGRHGTFKETLLARLSAADMPALAPFLTRDDADFTIAFCDAAAAMFDVLTFYQERIANEHYLRTAVEGVSLRELARLIGYQPAPGVAANVDLAFTLDEAPGAPELAALPVILPIGTRTQSVPGPHETAQTYETIEPVEARPAWNAIPVRADEPQSTPFGLTTLYLAGTSTQLVPGDIVVFVGTEREQMHESEQWDVRILSLVDVDVDRNLTRIAWAEGLGSISPSAQPAAAGVKLYVFRQRAALFGHNAPNPNLLSSNGTNLNVLAPANSSGWRTWANFSITNNQIDLDASYPRIAPGSWFALVNAAHPHLPASLAGYVELYRATSVTDLTRADFGLSSKVTRLTPDTTENLSFYDLRNTQVLAQSEELALSARPLDYPLYGTELAITRVERDLKPGRKIAVTGKPARLQVVRGAPPMTLTFADGTTRPLTWGDSLQIMAAPEQVAAGGSRVQVAPADLPQRIASATIAWQVRDRDGRDAALVAPGGALQLRPAIKADKVVSEIALVAAGAASAVHGTDGTTFQLQAPLSNVYDRYTATVNANVAAATQGESVGEILGNGDASRPNQRFTLKQAPLTFVSATTPSGRAATLDVRVSGVLWHETRTLYQADPAAREYALELNEGGVATVVFGDGIEGARLPSGGANIRATYRKGIGADGNAPAGRIKTLLTRPLGVNSVINPEDAYGGQDGETAADTRRRAPLSVLTLGRAVSIQDYADFARTFAGISKAHAVRLPLGPGRGLFTTVAGAGGQPLPEDGDTMAHLVAALRRFGDPMMPLQVHNYERVPFRLSAAVKVAADFLATGVLPSVRALLLERFGFDGREFGQPIAQDELVAVIHTVPGVEAVRLSALCLTGSSSLQKILWPTLPFASPTVAPLPAQLLVIDADSLDVEEMA